VALLGHEIDVASIPPIGTCVTVKVPLFGGERPWFVCSVYSNGHYCGRNVTKLYGAGKLFACRHCHGLAYASQQESSNQRGVYRAQKIRTRLGGSVSMFEDFPDKPKGMHWRTYDRLRGRYDMAEARSMAGLEHFLNRLDPILS